MQTIITIFKKEMLDTLRDRQTLIMMFAVPLFLLPIIFSLTSWITKSNAKAAMGKILTVAINDDGSGKELVKRLKRRRDIEFREDIKMSSYRQFVRNDSIDLALVIDENFDKDLAEGRTGNLRIFYNSTSDTSIFKKLSNTIEAYHQEILQERLDSLGANTATITPIYIESKNVYTQSEAVGKMIGSFLPYMFVIFCFAGGMYPAIDLFTGEKEKGTIETILSVPISRTKILIGKMLVVVLTGVISGLLTIVGIYLTLQLNPEVPSELKNIILNLINPFSISLIILMLIPLTTFFAGLLIPASIYAKSFKEAQTLIQPMMFVIIFPLVIGMMPGIKLTFLTAITPVLNVALASREIIAGTIDYGLLALVFISLIVFASIGIFMCVRWFSKEGNILRT